MNGQTVNRVLIAAIVGTQLFLENETPVLPGARVKKMLINVAQCCSILYLLAAQRETPAEKKVKLK